MQGAGRRREKGFSPVIFAAGSDSIGIRRIFSFRALGF
jgi:hypothetical protein